MIDTRHTDIDAYCPVRYQRPQCKVQRYRELDGMCNNLENPHWGAVMAPFRRLLAPNFQDGTTSILPSIPITTKNRTKTSNQILTHIF